MNTTTIKITQLNNGIYFYQLTNNEETYRGKFVKEWGTIPDLDYR